MGETIALLSNARKVANHACDLGVLDSRPTRRPNSHHIGAVLADGVLQAGLNYRSVVLPRVLAITERYPEAQVLDGVHEVISTGRLSDFLQWSHPTKLARFTAVVSFIDSYRVQEVSQLRDIFLHHSFKEGLLDIHGIGPKTADYFACLVGIDGVAVDRHLRTFARDSGVDVDDYCVLARVFSCAADLLALPRRDLDAGIWMKVSGDYGSIELVTSRDCRE
jgi:hypothetical protein